MADVTINELTKGTPTGNNILPYSTGSNTLGVPVSALFQNTSNVGIGIDNPVRRLEVNGAIKSYSAGGNLIFNSDSGYEWWTGSWNDFVSYQVTRRKISDGEGTSHLTINTLGNVGIGTITPSTKLDVNGDVKATSYKTGSLPMFGANAFVHFNGGLDINGNASTANTERRIYASGNVSSVLRNALGLYTIYFNTAMTTTEYMAVCSARHYDGLTWDVHCEVSNRQTTSCVVNVQSNYAGSPGSTAYDSRDVDVMIIC